MNTANQAAWKQLANRFPANRMTLEAWNEVKQRVKANEDVEGIVVAKAPFGDWIDIGVGFPALLEIIEISEMTPELYRSQAYNSVGTLVKARVSGLRDDNRQIYLSQLGSAHTGNHR